MRIIYIDSDYICHSKSAEGRIAIETDMLDFVTDAALPCYKFIPAHEGKVDFIQCTKNDADGMVREQYSADKEIIDILTGEVSINDEG